MVNRNVVRKTTHFARYVNKETVFGKPCAIAREREIVVVAFTGREGRIAASVAKCSADNPIGAV